MNVCSKYCDKELELLWEDLEDIAVYEDDDYLLRLEDAWHGFEAGTEVEEIWYWFDEHYSKGVGWLMNEYEPEWVRRKH